MLSKAFLKPVISAFILAFLLRVNSAADVDSAWEALHSLDIPRAKDLFRTELKKSPQNAALMRGLLLSAYFDLDYLTQAEMIRALIETEPGSPYLVPVFEHVAAKLEVWSFQRDLEKAIGAALAENSRGALSHVGEKITETYHRATAIDLPDDWHTRMGYPPGCWISGPIENESNIAAYRNVTFEGEILDTLATAIGKIGSRVGWTWLPTDKYGNFNSHMAFEDAEQKACQARIYFELPSRQEIAVLLGVRSAVDY